MDENDNPDDLIYRYKGSTANAKFIEFDNGFNLLDKVRESEPSLPDIKKDQAELKSNVSEI